MSTRMKHENLVMNLEQNTRMKHEDLEQISTRL